MNKSVRQWILLAASALVFTGCTNDTETTTDTPLVQEPGEETSMPKKSSVQDVEINWPCLNPPQVSAAIPGDTVISDQASFNCFAWQSFIGLNWSTSGNAFGQPGDFSPVVFETYRSNHDLFDYPGDKPPQWSDVSGRAAATKGGLLHSMSRTSKFDIEFEGSDIDEAFPSPSWLADKQGNLVWYQILMNQPEYEYFYDNGFYQASKQYQAASSGTHIDLPKGDLAGNIGAMELKAAWLTVTDPGDIKWQRYKLAQAEFCSAPGDCKLATVALVGLHVIHKTTSQPSWVWATFEHVDNVPDTEQVNAGTVGDNYNFYTDSCSEIDIPPVCVSGKMGEKTSCDSNIQPAYDLTLSAGAPTGQCLPYPIQVVRQYPIPSTDENPVRQTNLAAQKLIKQANNDSVYQYYQLVNVLWNDSTVDENKAEALPVGSLSKTGFRPNPNAFPVANTTMETYIQETACIECHSGATIAGVPKNGTQYASDYSFIFSMAK